MNLRLTSALGANGPFLPFIIKLPGISNGGAFDGTFKVLLYKGQSLPSNFEVEIGMETTFG